jgi:hypothetical protein
MRWILPLAVLFAGCTVTIRPLPTSHASVHRTHAKVKHEKPKPRETPAPKLPDMPPYPPPNYDDVIRRTHPTPTISPYDFR